MGRHKNFLGERERKREREASPQCKDSMIKRRQNRHPTKHVTSYIRVCARVYAYPRHLLLPLPPPHFVCWHGPCWCGVSPTTSFVHNAPSCSPPPRARHAHSALLIHDPGRSRKSFASVRIKWPRSVHAASSKGGPQRGAWRGGRRQSVVSIGACVRRRRLSRSPQNDPI